MSDLENQEVHQHKESEAMLPKDQEQAKERMVGEMLEMMPGKGAVAGVKAFDHLHRGEDHITNCGFDNIFKNQVAKADRQVDLNGDGKADLEILSKDAAKLLPKLAVISAFEKMSEARGMAEPAEKDQFGSAGKFKAEGFKGLGGAAESGAAVDGKLENVKDVFKSAREGMRKIVEKQISENAESSAEKIAMKMDAALVDGLEKGRR